MIAERHFAHPHGFLGRLAGRVMALENRALNRWTLELLELRPDDVVLEVGFGPGIALQGVSARLTSGRAAGVDPSLAMWRQARRRNRRAVHHGRVELRRGIAEALPWPPETFSRAFSVNSFHEWVEPLCGLMEIHRVLCPGGLLVLTTRARWLRPSGRLAELGELYRGTLADAGFGSVTLHQPAGTSRPAIALRAWKGPGAPG
jgi:ubiquinone/menaquinone biosynthesis C-methylase UbiE